MTITFSVAGKSAGAIAPSYNSVFLNPSNWDDYSFRTSFHATFSRHDGTILDLGTVKIGYLKQPCSSTYDLIPGDFEKLPDDWFSLGQDIEYYKNIHENLSPEEKNNFLNSMRDIAANNNLFIAAQDEPVLRNSLMRGVSISVINGQFHRALTGMPILTDFHFTYRYPGDDRNAAINIDFKVDQNSKPSTNVHVLIGRNGVGKTTVLNNMVGAIITPKELTEQQGSFYIKQSWRIERPLPENYFSSVVSVSFSAFDPFIPPADQPDRTRGVGYFYIGMKKARTDEAKPDQETEQNINLADDFIESLDSCLSQQEKRRRWTAAITRLQSDDNFAEMTLSRLLDMDHDSALAKARERFNLMSSGHKIVLLTITRLVDTVEEKTLVLMDEPEGHLHPPLLSALTRALSDLLHDRNGVAIIATHSPVVVQEVPRSCVWILTRLRAVGRSDRPERETFGENVGILTREIFGLEVSKSGFHEMLTQAVANGGTFESIINDYNEQLGYEAQTILRTLISARDATT